MVFHHIGSFLLLASAVLLIVVSVSSPVVNDFAFLNVHSNEDSSNDQIIRLGNWGYCLTQDGQDDQCTDAHVGYHPVDYLRSVVGNNVDYSDARRHATNVLTRIMILHPIAAAVDFLAFLFAVGAGFVGSLCASMVAVVGTLITVFVMLTDFVLFSYLRGPINDDTNWRARWGPMIWLVLASAICSLLGAILVFLTCCRDRRRGTRTPKGFRSSTV